VCIQYFGEDGAEPRRERDFKPLAPACLLAKRIAHDLGARCVSREDGRQASPPRRRSVRDRLQFFIGEALLAGCSVTSTPATSALRHALAGEDVEQEHAVIAALSALRTARALVARQSPGTRKAKSRFTA
jgi:hypothetical protein